MGLPTFAHPYSDPHPAALGAGMATGGDPAPGAQPLRPPAPTLLRGALVPAVEGPGERKDVLLEGGRIAQVGPAGSIANPGFAEVVDCAERMLLPGFVNAHTHSVEHWARGLIKPLPLELWLQQLIRHEPRGEAGWKGQDSWLQTPACAIGLSAMVCGAESMLSGCTAIMDHLLIRDLDDLDAAVQAYKALGIRAFIVPAPHPWHTLAQPWHSPGTPLASVTPVGLTGRLPSALKPPRSAAH